MKLRHRLEYAALVGFAAIARVLPRRAALALGAAIGRLGWWLRLRRSLVLRNLAQALPELSEPERRGIAGVAARNFGRTAVEFIRFAGGDRYRIGEIVRISGLEHLQRALAEGRGALLVTAHLGGWALYVTALTASGLPSALLVGRQHNELVDRFILGIPGEAARFISKGRAAPREVLRSLREGRVVVMVADQDAGPQGAMVPFLGRTASTLPLPGAIAARHDTPVLTMTGHRVDVHHHQVQIVPIGSRWSAPEEVTTAFNEALGAAVRAHPEHYFWYHRRWRDYETGRERTQIAVERSPSTASSRPSDNDLGA